MAHVRAPDGDLHSVVMPAAEAARHALRCGALMLALLSGCARDAATVQTLPGSRIVVSHTFHW